MLVVEDILFTISHRTIHIPFLYRHIHRKHHEHKITIGLASTYAHPVEFFFGNVLPFAAGSLMLGSRMHNFTYNALVIWRLMDTGDAHTGYELPWSPFTVLPFTVGGEYHDFHHAKQGNYVGHFCFIDSIFGNNTDYYKHL